MDINRLRRKATDLFEQRGGSERLKSDAERLKGIAQGPGTLSEKAKRAADAVKEPRPDTRGDQAGGASGSRPGSSTEPPAGGGGGDRPGAS